VSCRIIRKEYGENGRREEYSDRDCKWATQKGYSEEGR